MMMIGRVRITDPANLDACDVADVIFGSAAVDAKIT
jgi:hypothetical protein